jgi:hypothetical protein
LPGGLATLRVNGASRQNTVQSSLSGNHTWSIYPTGGNVTLDQGLQPVAVTFSADWNLIGGPGADRFQFIHQAGLDGNLGGDSGSGDNLLIGGYTSDDQNLAALNALFAEWPSADSLAVRISAISSGGGLNASYVLNPMPAGGRPATLFDDGAADHLFDGRGSSWFFQHRPDDSINNGAGPLVNGDVVADIP